MKSSLFYFACYFISHSFLLLSDHLFMEKGDVLTFFSLLYSFALLIVIIPVLQIIPLLAHILHFLGKLDFWECRFHILRRISCLMYLFTAKLIIFSNFRIQNFVDVNLCGFLEHFTLLTLTSLWSVCFNKHLILIISNCDPN